MIYIDISCNLKNNIDLVHSRSAKKIRLSFLRTLALGGLGRVHGGTGISITSNMELGKLGPLSFVKSFAAIPFLVVLTMTFIGEETSTSNVVVWRDLRWLNATNPNPIPCWYLIILISSQQCRTLQEDACQIVVNQCICYHRVMTNIDMENPHF